MIKLVVKKEEENQKLEKYIKKVLNNTSLSMIQKLFRKKDIKVNDKRQSKDYVVKENDIVLVYLPDFIEKPTIDKKVNKMKITFDILYEDENILVVNKPMGLLVHEDDSSYYNTLNNQVLYYLLTKQDYVPSSFIAGPAHRLDRNTSGIVLFGKNIESLQILNNALKERNGLEKYYLALLFNKLDNTKEVRCKLLKDEKSGMVRVNKNGLDSFSIFSPIKYNNEYTLCSVKLMTGRTHQIRVHANYIGCPVVGDKKYGDFNKNKEFEKLYVFENQFLHAYKIVFKDLEGKLAYLNGTTIKCDLDSKKALIVEKIFKNS